MRSATEAGRLASCSGPSKDYGGHSLPPRRHRRDGHLSWDSPRSRVLSTMMVRAIGFLSLPPRRSPFPVRPRGFQPPPSPAIFITGSSSRALSFPPEFLVRPPAQPNRAPSMGFLALIATSTGGVHARGHPKPASFRPRRFARPRRLAPLPALWVCFTPLPRPGFALQGFPLARSGTGSSPAPALLSFARDPCQQFPAGSRTSCPPSGLFSSRESVADRDGLDHRPLDPLLSFTLLRVLLRAP
jgi:hypothetical protein